MCLQDENLQLLFDEKDLADKALKALQGAKIQRMMPSNRAMLQREMDQRKEKQAAKDNKKKEQSLSNPVLCKNQSRTEIILPRDSCF